MKNFKKAAAVLLFLAVFLLNGFCQNAGSVENLTHYTLKNGLELYVAENHTVPLAYIEICFKTGGVSQTAQNAGLFHLYEHMMFKGNSKFKTAEDLQNAMTELGVTNYNGTTSGEKVNYFFTLPKSQLKKGLEFWNYAVRKPTLDKRELEAEKKVVISEITGDQSNPGYMAQLSKHKDLFAEAPYKTDVLGSVYNLQNATVEQLKEIQKNYFIPNNAALFVGGDVNPAEVYKLVNSIYGSWAKGKIDQNDVNFQFSKTPFTKPILKVLPYDQISPQIAQISVSYRGPDAFFDRQDTYTIDMLLKYAANPASVYKTELVQNPKLKIPGNEYCGLSYVTMRKLGVIENVAVVLDPQDNLPQRAILFAELLPELLKKQIPDENDPSAIAEKEMIFNIMNNSRVFEQETAAGLLSQAEFWWCCTDVDYYFGYMDELEKVTGADMEALVDKYFNGTFPLITVYVNPDVYAVTKASFAAAGFEEITQQNAFWWSGAASK